MDLRRIAASTGNGQQDFDTPREFQHSAHPPSAPALGDIGYANSWSWLLDPSLTET